MMEMLAATYFLFILGLGLAQEEPYVSNPETSTDQGHKGFLHAEINVPEDFENRDMWSFQRRVTFPILRDFMKLLATLDGTSLKSVWNILNNMKGSRSFLDVLFYEYLPDLTGEEFEFPRELFGELQREEGHLPYAMVHKSGSLGTPSEESNTLNSDQGLVSDVKDWEKIDCNQGYDNAFGDDEFISNLGDEPNDSHYKYPIQVGSIMGIPGEDFPDYYDIPITSFGCVDKKRIPGFYADLETGCQVFHVCWPHRRESFLCPIGTIFNQAILACDYWYSTDCSLAPLYYDNDPFAHGSEVPTATTESVIDDLLEETAGRIPSKHRISATKPSTEYIPKDESEDLETMLKFLPVKSKITSYLEPVEAFTRVSTPISYGLKESVPEEKVKIGTKDDLDDMLLSDGFLGIADSVAKVAMKHVAKLHSKDKKHQIQENLETKSRLHEPYTKPISKPIPLVLKKPVVPIIRKERPLTKINPRFVVKPTSVKVSHKKLKVVPLIKSSKLLKPKKQLKGYYLKSTKISKEHIPKILNKSFKLASSVLHDGILPLTRKILIESYAKHSKVNKH